MSQRAAQRGWSAVGWAVGYWAAALGAALLLIAAWLWCGLSYYEVMTEQCKALAASTTMAGFGFGFGLVPLVVAHLVVLVVVGGIGFAGRRSRRSAVVHVLAALVVPSVIGLVLTQLMLGGELFSTGATGADCLPNLGYQQTRGSTRD